MFRENETVSAFFLPMTDCFADMTLQVSDFGV